MAKKKVTFRLFNISNDSLKDKENPLIADLKQSLHNGKRYVDSRIMKLKDTDLSDEDVLAYFTITEEYVYGMMIRIASAKDVPELPTNFANLESIDVNDLLKEAEKKDDGKKVCKSYYRFFLKGDYLVTDMSRNVDIIRFEDYVNWILLRSEMTDDQKYHFNPAIDKGRVEVSRLKAIVVTDAFSPLPVGKKNPVKKWSDSILNFFVESGDLNMKQLHKENIISAKLTLNFDRPKDMTVADYVDATSAILKTAGKPENIQFLFNGGVPLSGNKLLFQKPIEMEGTTDKDYIHAMKGVIDNYEK